MIRHSFVALALFLGLSAGFAPQAKAETSVNECLVEGNIDLRINGTDQFGSVSGWIGSTSFYGRISAGRLHGTLGNLNLNLFVDSYGRQDFVISGWIAGTSVRWMSFGNWFNNGYVCIEN